MSRGVAGLLVIAMVAIVWWFAGHPGYETREQKFQRQQASGEAATPKLYRWVDEKGVTQITQSPPKGRKYKVIEIREDQNIIDSPAPAPEPPQ